MEVLELNPPSMKLTVILVEKEYNELLQELELGTNRKSEIPELRTVSAVFKEFIKKLALNSKPDFATEELGSRSTEKFYKENPLAEIFKSLKIPFSKVDIDESAKLYLLNEIDVLRGKLSSILARIAEMKEENYSKNEIEYLTEYAKYLQYELEKKVSFIKHEVREAWIVKNIIKTAEKIAKKKRKKELTGIHICSPIHLNGVAKILESLGVEVQAVSMKKEYLIEKRPDRSVPRSISIKVKPFVKVAIKKLPYILFFLSTDEIASPFDICMAYDAGFDIVKTYENISPDRAKTVVQDAMFSRGPKGIKRTCFFIGGKDLYKVEEILEVVKKTMFPPFETSVVADPRGAYTTAASMVAKAEEGLNRAGLGRLSDKVCAVFGTGPVGIITSVLLSKLGCDTVIVEPYEKLNQAYVSRVVNQIKTKYGVHIRGVFAPTKIERATFVWNADVIFTAVAPGVRVIDSSILNEITSSKLFVDINAVPPLGVEDMNLKDDMKELRHAIYGIGALTIGDLKYKVEMEILKTARLHGKGIYDYNYALNAAREILKGKKTLIPEFAVTLTSRS